MNATTDRFVASLEELNVTPVTTTADALLDALRERLEGPAVGVPLGIEGPSLGALPVELDPAPADLEAAVTGVTPAALGIAETGSILLADRGGCTEAVSLYPRRHVAILPESDLVDDLGASMGRLAAAGTAGTSAVVATGPSATADMGALVEGAHGPAEVDVLLVTDR